MTSVLTVLGEQVVEVMVSAEPATIVLSVVAYVKQTLATLKVSISSLVGVSVDHILPGSLSLCGLIRGQTGCTLFEWSSGGFMSLDEAACEWTLRNADKIRSFQQKIINSSNST